MFGLQKGETYEYEDAVETVMGKVRLGKHTGEIILNENSGSYTVWVKGIGNVGIGFRKDEAIADARKNINAKASKAGLGISRKSLGVSQASLTGYSGNIRPYDLFEIQQRLEAFCRKNNTSLKALQTKYLSSGFSPTRFRFDLFNAAVVPAYDTAQGKSQVHNRLNAYADDKDVDKAMAFIIARSK